MRLHIQGLLTPLIARANAVMVEAERAALKAVVGWAVAVMVGAMERVVKVGAIAGG